ncbi:hypothetical protein BJY04DRAFT_54451 [Aspergillus karnatakaensis]|uniref:uncharacterized protein n=1 Tax=Aspergillus karnatakaensis TaxID=1810916 RepID=UPI003CCCB1CE
MAEVLGVVASGIALVTLLEQIIESINKLSALRTFVKTIPHELRELIEEIEIVQAVLRTLTPEMFKFLNIASTERRLLTFHNDLRELISEVQKYQASAKNRKLGAVRLVLKREEIRAQRRNLDNIKGTLLLLQQTYCSLSMLHIISKTGHQNASASLPSTSSSGKTTMISHSPQFPRKKAKTGTTRSNQWEYRFRTPLIVIDKLWLVQMNRSISGWTFTIQSYNIIPKDAMALEYCWNGDVEGLRGLFAAGLAGPNDCEEDGTSLLTFLHLNSKYLKCSWSMERTLTTDPLQICKLDRVQIRTPTWLISTRSPLFRLATYSSAWQKDLTVIEKAQDMCQLLLTYMQDTIDIVDVYSLRKDSDQFHWVS